MNFDFNIDNYTRDELIEMFDLPPQFDKNIVEIKATKLRENLTKNKNVSTDILNQTFKFITNAKQIILSETNKSPEIIDEIKNFYNSSYELKPTAITDEQEHMVQVRKDKPYLSSFPSEFFPGIINPLKKRTIKKNLNIDTRFRENYHANTSTNFNMVLPTSFNNVIQMQLSSIELPTTFYTISQQYGNNYFNITVNSETTTIVIPNGNYTSQTIMSIINSQLSSAGSPFNAITFKVNLVGEQTGSGQTLITSDSSVTVLELDFETDLNNKNVPLPLKLGWILGFRQGIYNGCLNYASEGIVDTTGPKYFFLVIDDYHTNVNNSFYSAFNSSILNKNIIARISLKEAKFNILDQYNLNITTTPREYFGPVNLNNFTIQLLDEYGRIVDLNYMDYSFCLNLITVYDI